MLYNIVFLRVLEYYNGLLFLTTNRPGALDEAFESRIHLKLYYPPLNFEQTQDIWEMNIERLRMIETQRCQGTNDQPMEIFDEEVMQFASKQFTQNEKHRWNGRQIRNAFQIAASLAHFDAQHIYEKLKESHKDTLPPRPKLDIVQYVYPFPPLFSVFYLPISCVYWVPPNLYHTATKKKLK